MFGAAILHHLVEPGQFVKHAMRVLKPGGVAFFFEPLEGGHAMLLSICNEIKREAKRRISLKRWKALETLEAREAAGLCDLFDRVAIGCVAVADFSIGDTWMKDLDDKWAFPRSVIDEMARDAGATATVYMTTLVSSVGTSLTCWKSMSA